MRNHPLYCTYLILIALAAASLVLALAMRDHSSQVAGLSSNLATELVGIIVTLILVDRVLERHEQRERERYRNLAIRQLGRPLREHVNLLFDMFKAAVPKLPAVHQEQPATFFNESYFEALRWLDFSRPAPVTPTRTWINWATAEFQRFRSDLSSIADRYGFFLNADMIELIEQITNSHLTSYMAQVAFAYGQGGVHPCLFAMTASMVKEHCDLVVRATNLVNSRPSDALPVVTISAEWRRNDISPSVGSARFQGPLPSTPDS